MSKKPRRFGELEHGRILDVTEETLGTTLLEDAAAGATVLTVDDAGDFEDDGSGGWLSINGQVVDYSTVVDDDESGTITLKSGLTAAAVAGDRVAVWSKLYGTESTVKTALVQVDGYDDNTDPIIATLADAVQDLPEGLRGEAGENCTLQRVSEDEWEVSSVPGRPAAAGGGGDLYYEDTHVVTFPDNEQRFTLTYLPKDHSDHVRWHPGGGAGVDWSEDEWTRVGQEVTIPNTDRILAVDDKFTVKYAYRQGITATRWDEPVTVVRSRPINVDGSDTLLPDLTQVGDALVVVTNGPGLAGFFRADDPEHYPPSWSGVDQVHSVIYPRHNGNGVAAAIYVGVVKRLDPIRVFVNRGPGATTAVAVAYTIPGQIDMSRVTGNNPGNNSGSVDYRVPRITGRGSGALLVQVNWGFIGGGYGDFKVVDENSGTPWNSLGQLGTYHCIGAAWTNRPELTEDVLVHVKNTGWADSYMLGISGATG